MLTTPMRPTPLAGWKPTLQVPTPDLAPWQRVDAAWPVIPNSPTGLDGDIQKLVRRLLTQAAGHRLRRRRHLEEARLWLWQPQPYLAQYVRQPRFYPPALRRCTPAGLPGLLQTEARLALEVITTPPHLLGVEVWQEVLALQCQRIAQVYAAMQHWLEAGRARAILAATLEDLI